MARKTFTITDLDHDLHLSDAAFGPADVGGAAKSWSVKVRTLSGGLRDGVQIVDATTGALRIVVVPTRGMAIWKFWWIGVEVGWQSPTQGPVHPKFVPLMEPGGLGWIAGFDELLCRCGLESNGAPEWDDRGRLLWPLHGRIANLPAHALTVTVDGDSGEVAISGVVDEARLFGQKLRLTSTTIVRPDAPLVRVRDEIVNRSAEPAELELLYHVNFGRPIGDAGARLVVPAREVCPRDDRAAARAKEWDRYGTPQPQRSPLPRNIEEVFYMELHADAQSRTRALLAAAGGDSGASLGWDVRQLPCFTQWKNPQMAADAYVTGLEPGTNYPNQRRFEKLRKRVVPLASGATWQVDLDLEYHPDRAAVERAERDVARIAAKRVALLQTATLPKYAPL
jgi:hypothetical protein